MAGTYTNLNYHLVFSTKERRQLITANIEVEHHKYIGGIIEWHLDFHNTFCHEEFHL
jgi:REP element-mobilizing transposase RayT